MNANALQTLSHQTKDEIQRTVDYIMFSEERDYFDSVEEDPERARSHIYKTAERVQWWLNSL